ncbi:MAG: hypothetical protein DYG98_27120 [Haliscomenobacteraceae bacterium CHB4]|nr:hypothetical protein [Haliscomenobacteraceae bacterium CHB4]
MRKTCLLFICLIVNINSLLSQNIWHKKVPFNAINVSLCQLNTDGEHYFINGSRSFIQVDQLGTVTGFFDQEALLPFWVSVKKRYEKATGNPYFWIIHRDTSPYRNYTFAKYQPGTGIVTQKTFSDSLTPISWRQPQILDLDDSTVVVFGRKYFRKIKYSETGGFSEEWVKSLDIPVTAALLHDGIFILASETGLVTSLNEDGSQNWANNHPLGCRSLKTTADGYIGCGRTPENMAAVIRLTFGGGETWFKTTSDADYYDVINTSDGGFVVTGISDSSKICLIKFDASGAQVWKREYSKGTGFGVLEAPDGGFVLAGRGTNPNGSLYIIKTDSQGLTAPVEDAPITGRQISTSSLQATLFPRSSIFFDGNSPQFISLADTGAATIFTFAPSIGGYDPDNILHLAADNYGLSVFDFRPGLVQSPARDFNRVWSVERKQIEQLRRDILLDDVLDELTPYDLITWPAKGNPHLKFNIDFTPVTTSPDLFPAPFRDINNDGIYNVYDGDYPLIKGDQMAWWVMTDSTEHTLSHGNAMQVDLLISVFGYDCPQTGTVDKSLFVDFDVINRSVDSYQNTYMGFFTDFDLGCYHDDYVGTMSDVNTYYVYNQDTIDLFCDQGVQGFGHEIPVQTATFINKTLHHTTTYFLPLGPGYGPDLPSEFYNILQGKWSNGVPLTEGGTGYSPNSTDYTNYIFPDNPADPQGWTMCSGNFNLNDMEMFASHGPFNFAAGDTFNIQVAFTLHPDIPHPCPDIFGLVKPAVAQISQWKNDGALDAGVDLGQVVSLPPGQSVTLDPGIVPGAIYSWSTGASAPTITVTQPGEYTVTVTLSTGCQVVENVLVQLGTSVKQPDITPYWSVHPLPASDFVYVECPDCAEGNLQAILRNAQGAALLNLEGQGNQFRMTIQHLPTGFYWMELWQKGRFLGSKKLVIAGK